MREVYEVGILNEIGIEGGKFLVPSSTCEPLFEVK
jgi:hypothetical protein